jgi:fucose permease
MLFGFLAIFFYVGVEVMAGDAVGTYGNGFQLPIDETKFFTTLTMITMLAGYVCGLVCVPRFFSQATYLVLSAAVGIGLSFGAFATTGYASVGFVWALGFANAMMWPAIFPLGIRGLGKLTELASAFLIMGIIGGAVFPQLYAHLKDAFGFQLVFAGLTIPAYVYLLAFGLFARRSDEASSGPGGSGIADV